MRKPETKLERAVAKWLRDYGKGYDDGPQGAYDDLMQGGCESGIVGGMIYYTDTVRFYRRHMAEIDKMITNLLIDNDGSLTSLFGVKWDTDDPLGRDYVNQNLLAWFGFEETARNLMEVDA